MLNTHVNERREVPLWAAVGAPLLGVPLLVALLAVTAPKQEMPVDEAKADATTEQVEDQAVDHAASLRADHMEPPNRS